MKQTKKHKRIKLNFFLRQTHAFIYSEESGISQATVEMIQSGGCVAQTWQVALLTPSLASACAAEFAAILTQLTLCSNRVRKIYLTSSITGPRSHKFLVGCFNIATTLLQSISTCSRYTSFWVASLTTLGQASSSASSGRGGQVRRHRRDLVRSLPDLAGGELQCFCAAWLVKLNYLVQAELNDMVMFVFYFKSRTTSLQQVTVVKSGGTWDHSLLAYWTTKIGYHFRCSLADTSCFE